jgi:hypothetical protein
MIAMLLSCSRPQVIAGPSEDAELVQNNPGRLIIQSQMTPDCWRNLHGSVGISVRIVSNWHDRDHRALALSLLDRQYDRARPTLTAFYMARFGLISPEGVRHQIHKLAQIAARCLFSHQEWTHVCGQVSPFVAALPYARRYTTSQHSLGPSHPCVGAVPKPSKLTASSYASARRLFQSDRLLAHAQTRKLADGVRFELTVGVNPRQFSRLEP